jgi:hypothetical protein
LFELLPMMPRFGVEHVRQRLETTFPTANAAVELLEELGIVTEHRAEAEPHLQPSGVCRATLPR